MHRNRKLPPAPLFEIPPDLNRHGYGLVSASVLPVWHTGHVMEKAELGFLVKERIWTMEGPGAGMVIQDSAGRRIVRPDHVRPYGLEMPQRGPRTLKDKDSRRAGPFQFTPVRWPRNGDRGRYDYVAFLEPRGHQEWSNVLGDSARGRMHRPWLMPEGIDDFDKALRHVEGFLLSRMRTKESKRRSGRRRGVGPPLSEPDAAIFVRSVVGGRSYSDIIIAACAASDVRRHRAKKTHPP